MEFVRPDRHPQRMTEIQLPGQRLAQLAAGELSLLVRELAKARKGRDSGVHRARKALQRLRSLLRLVREVDPAWHARTDAQLRQLRRKLGPLRDAAVRAELASAMLDAPLDEGQRAAVQGAVATLKAARDEAWAALPERFWDRIDHGVARHLAGFDRWPLAEATPEVLHSALERARRKAKSTTAKALGHAQRNVRHDLRRLLRRYAAMRKAAASALRQRDPSARMLVEVARDLGVEGDLWLTCTALKAADGSSVTAALRRELERQRRALCRQHDGELASLRRGALSREQAGHRERARAARKAARGDSGT